MGTCTCGKTKDPNGNCDGSHKQKDYFEISEKELKDYGQRNDTKERLQR